MITRNRIASVGRDLGIQIYNQEAIEWQEHLREAVKEKPGEKPVKAEPDNDFIKDALSIFNPPAKPEAK